VFKNISNMTKFYCPNKSIYYFFKINTKISTSFRRSMLISFWIYVPAADRGGEGTPGASPYTKIGKNMTFWSKIVIFHKKYPKKFRASFRSAQFFYVRPLTWNPGSAPDIDLNMHIINVIADDDLKIGVYEIYFLNDYSFVKMTKKWITKHYNLNVK
jgi:hypothetical protein